MAKHFQVDTGGTLTTSLLSYYPMEGNSNDYWSTNNGSDTSISYSTGAGKVNQGAALGGSPSKIVTGNNIGFSGSGAFSFAAWIYPTNLSNTSDQCIAYTGGASNGGSAGTAAFMQIRFPGEIHLGFFGGSGDNTSPSNILTQNAWNHVVVTYAGGALSSSTVKMYLNGSSVTVSAGSLTPNVTASPFQIGEISNLGNWFSGDIDELGVWGKVLSTQEITDLYNSGSGQTMVNATAYTKTMADSILIGASRTSTNSRIGTFSRSVSASIMNGASRVALVGKGINRSMNDTIMNAASRLASVISGKGFVATISDSIMNAASRLATVMRAQGFYRTATASIMNGASRFASLYGARITLVYLSDTMAAARGRLDTIKAYVNGLNIIFKEKYNTQETVWEDKYQ